MTTPNDNDHDDDAAPIMCPRTGSYCDQFEPGIDCEAYGCASDAGIAIEPDEIH